MAFRLAGSSFSYINAMEREQEVEYIDAVGSDGDSIMASKGKVSLTTGKCGKYFQSEFGVKFIFTRVLIYFQC